MNDQSQIEFALAKMRRNEVPGLSMCVLAEHFDALQERFDWLATQQGSALVSDDHSRWAVVTDGVQNNPGNKPTDIHTTFFIRAADWKPSVIAAIDAARAASADFENTPAKCPECDMDQVPGSYFCWHCEYRFDAAQSSPEGKVGE